MECFGDPSHKRKIIYHVASRSIGNEEMHNLKRLRCPLNATAVNHWSLGTFFLPPLSVKLRERYMRSERSLLIKWAAGRISN